MQPELVKASRHLSKILRHDPASAGITLDKNGWASVDEILDALNINIEQLESIVHDNDKQRFELDTDKIRARQGHSVDVDLQLEEKTPPSVLYHGTTETLWVSIQKTGLQKMKRHHVHLSADKHTAQKVAERRKDKTIILQINAAAMRADGIKFYQSSNGVWLTNEVASKYISI